MTDLELIESSPEIREELSELLFKALGLGCWHEWVNHTTKSKKSWQKDNLYKKCRNCKKLVPFSSAIFDGLPVNPNLFSDWTGFGMVFEAVTARKFKSTFNNIAFMLTTIIGENNFNFIDYLRNNIATPHFQLQVALWLDREGVERILEKGRGE